MPLGQLKFGCVLDGDDAFLIGNKVGQTIKQRLEVLVQSAAELPVESIHRQISSAIDLVVQLKRCNDGSRVISHVSEVLPPHAKQHQVRMKHLFELSPEGLVPTGRIPTFMEKLLLDGHLDLDTFYVQEG